MEALLSSVHCLQKNRAQSKAEKTARLPWAGPSSPLPQLGVLSPVCLSGDMAVNQARCPPGGTCFSPFEGDEPRFLGESSTLSPRPYYYRQGRKAHRRTSFSNLNMQVAQRYLTSDLHPWSLQPVFGLADFGGWPLFRQAGGRRKLFFRQQSS